MGRRLCGTKEVQSPRRSLSRAWTSRRRDVQAWDSGSVISGMPETTCLLNAENVWSNRICLGSIRKCMGRRICSTKEIQSARRSLPRASFHVEGKYRLGSWVSKQREEKTPCLLNAESGWMPSDLFGTRSKVHGKRLCGVKEVQGARKALPRART